MKNEMDQGDAHEMPRDPRHEELCAYVLGECDAETRARVEAELENDAGLRAEKEQLERTIGAVQSAVVSGVPEQLQIALPTTSRSVPWLGLGIAAAAVVLTTTVVVPDLWNQTEGENSDDVESVSVVTDREAANTPSGLPRQNERTILGAPVQLDQYGKDGRAAPRRVVDVELAQAAVTPSFTKTSQQLVQQSQQPGTSGSPGGGGHYRGVTDIVPPNTGKPEATVATVTPGVTFNYDRAFQKSGAAPVDNRSALYGVVGEAPAGTATGLSGTTAGLSVLDLNSFGQGMNGLDPIAANQLADQLKSDPSVALRFETLPEWLLDATPTAGYFEPGSFDVFGLGSGGGGGTIALPRLGDTTGVPVIDLDAFFKSCHPRKNERPRDMYFRFWGDNAFVITRQDKLATFAADVDTASFVLARRYLRDGHLPVKAQIRTEEFVNFFDPDLPAPTEQDLAIHVEAVKSPFGGSDNRYLLRVGIRAREIPRDERDPVVLTFVVDNSGSMKEDNRIELVKHALRTLTAQLEEGDQIGIVAFNGEARLVLPITDCGSKDTILASIDQLTADGSTNAEAGLLLGYELASRALSTRGDAHHRVVLLSDGVANVGETDQDEILKKVEGHRLEGIHLNTVGVGMDNHNDVFLEQLANNGDGMCDYVDDARTVHQALVERFTGAFQPVASDVKIQVEFTGDRVLRWRQLGYENRAVADQDFRNDAVDAGEIGSGHQVTALFEVEDSGVTFGESEWAKVRVRWMPPRRAGGSETPREATEIETVIDMDSLAKDFPSSTPGFQRAALVAQFAEVLRRSTHARGDSWDQLVKETTRVVTLPEFVQDADTAELVSMLQAADKLGLDEEMEISPLAEAVQEYQRHHYLKHQLKCMEKEWPESELKELQRQNDLLEARIRGLLKGH